MKVIGQAMRAATPPFVIFVDVDDTFVRSTGSKRIPVVNVLRHIRKLHQQGAVLYCWSSGGAEYARSSAEEFEVADCFTGFLPKPNVIVDDQSVADWRSCLEVNTFSVAEGGCLNTRIAWSRKKGFAFPARI